MQQVLGRKMVDNLDPFKDNQISLNIVSQNSLHSTKSNDAKYPSSLSFWSSWMMQVVMTRKATTIVYYFLKYL